MKSVMQKNLAKN